MNLMLYPAVARQLPVPKLTSITPGWEGLYHTAETAVHSAGKRSKPNCADFRVWQHLPGCLAVCAHSLSRSWEAESHVGTALAAGAQVRVEEH